MKIEACDINQINTQNNKKNEDKNNKNKIII